MFFTKNGPRFTLRFQSRAQAGQLLAQDLKKIENLNNVLICAIPRGGVVVGAAIAKELAAPLTVLLVKKIGVPGNPELAIGAVAAWGRPFWDKNLISTLAISKEFLKDEVKKSREEVKRREIEYGVKKPKFSGQTLILTDDGIATGATITLAAKLIRNLSPKKLILAVPVASVSTLQKLKKYFDEIVAILTPADFRAVGQFYHNFPQVTDEEVKEILKSKNQNAK